MADPKVKIMNMTVAFGTAREHQMVEAYCAMEFGCDLVTQLSKVCERWLAKAVINVKEEEKALKSILKAARKKGDPSQN